MTRRSRTALPVALLSLVVACYALSVALVALSEPSNREATDRVLVAAMRSHHPDADSLEAISMGHRICAAFDEGWTYGEVQKTGLDVGIDRRDVDFMIFVSVRYLCPEHGVKAAA